MLFVSLHFESFLIPFSLPPVPPLQCEARQLASNLLPSSEAEHALTLAGAEVDADVNLLLVRADLCKRKDPCQYTANTFLFTCRCLSFLSSATPL